MQKIFGMNTQPLFFYSELEEDWEKYYFKIRKDEETKMKLQIRTV